MKKGEDYTGIVVCYFCHDGEGNVLLSKRSEQCRDEHGRWDPGGGGLEFGHSPEETLYKEILEEYCTDVLEYEFLGSRNLDRTHKGTRTHWVSLDFKVLVDKQKVKNGEPHKFDAVEWFAIDSLPKPLHSQVPHFLEKYNDKLF